MTFSIITARHHDRRKGVIVKGKKEKRSRFQERFVSGLQQNVME
jgi:hypothetical protein